MCFVAAVRAFRVVMRTRRITSIARSHALLANWPIEFRYDNSANNKNNPDPSRWVYQGFQSWEEMMAPNLGFLLDRDADISGLMSVQN